MLLRSSRRRAYLCISAGEVSITHPDPTSIRQRLVGPDRGRDRGPHAPPSVALLYERLQLLVPPGRREVTTRGLFAGEPIRIGALAHLLDLDAYVSWWLGAAEQILDPRPVFALPWPCPHCDAQLTAFAADERVECGGVDPADPDRGHVWEGAGKMRQLAVILASEHDDVRPEQAERVDRDRRRGARPNWRGLAEAAGG